MGPCVDTYTSDIKFTWIFGIPNARPQVGGLSMKKWYYSKTLWINLLSILILVLQYCGDIHIINLELQLLLMAIFNMLLRSITKQPIRDDNKNKKINGGNENG
jgi:hypothetical protein